MPENSSQFQSRSLDDNLPGSAINRNDGGTINPEVSSHRPSIAALAYPSHPSNKNQQPSRANTYSNHKPQTRPALISNQSLRPLSFSHPSTSTLNPTSEEDVPTWRATAIGSTPLDRTIDAIGMGRYQWALLFLSGCGWAADNMWLQAVAIILPRVQDEWRVDDRWIGLVSSSTFAGMMVGAISWGTYSDSFGRVSAFNHTLLVTSIFGLLSAFSSSFPMLCLSLFLLGTGVGGSMPTDGTLFLENLPKRKQYLLTALSVFFAMGSVMSSVLGLIIIPTRSCPEKDYQTGVLVCDVQKENSGWRWLLASCGIVTLIFVIARLVFFKLFESPKFLVANGRSNEARVILQRIAVFNGAPLPLSLSDVRDGEEASSSGPKKESVSSSKTNNRSWLGGNGSRSNGYQAVPTESEEVESQDESTVRNSEDSPRIIPSPITSTERTTPRSSLQNQLNPSIASSTPKSLLERLSVSMSTLSERYSQLFTPNWKKTTILTFLIWTLISLAYTSFNVFLPKYLESRLSSSSTSTPIININSSTSKAREQVMFYYVLYALASLPGSLLGAWLIETKLGRVGTLSLSVAFTGLSILGFALVKSQTGVVISSMVVSIMATTAYAALYGYTPEVFPVSLRASACGAASALSRLAGILAPLLAGYLLTLGVEFPLYASGFTLLATAGCAVALPIETRGNTNEAGEEEGAGGVFH